MIHNKAGAILLASTLAAAAQSQVTCAHAAGRYDGTWSMVVFTRTGPCDAAYRFSGQIVNGVITYGSLGIDLAGYVGSGGDTYCACFRRRRPCGGLRTDGRNARRRALARPHLKRILHRNVGGDADVTAPA